MDKKYKWSNLVIGVGLVLVLFSAPHLIDDFLYDIPEEFGLTNQQTQVLAGIFHVQLIVFFVLAARKRKTGYYGLVFWGIFLALAGILKHLPEILKPEPYWSGLFSETLIIGMIFAGIVLAITSILAIRDLSQPKSEE
jgi:ABC-type antimicrobial peptide transport system permease subunit